MKRTFRTLAAWGLFLGILALALTAYHSHVAAQPGDGYLLAKARTENLGTSPAIDPGSRSAADRLPLLADATGSAARLAGDVPEPVGDPTPASGPSQPPDASDAPVSGDSVNSESGNEVTPEKIGAQLKTVVSTWETLGWLAGLAALITLLVMVLKYKPIDALFKRWKIKWVKPLIASVLGGLSAGIGAYLAEGDIMVAIIAGLVIIGPAAVGFFETLNKIRKRNRDSGKDKDGGDG